MDNERIKRTFQIKDLKVRSKQLNTGGSSSGDPIIIDGYAAVFNSPTLIDGLYKEEIAPGAFSNYLAKNPDARCLYNHNWDKILGRMSSRTLTLEEDSRGLRFEVELPKTSYANDLAESMRRGDVGECSFLFDTLAQEEDFSGELPLIRITDCELYEVSIVTLPQYEEAKASMRSKQVIKNQKRRKKIIEKIGGYIHE